MSIIFSIIAVAMFYLFPTFIGKTVMQLGKQKNMPYAPATYFVLGSLLLFFFALLGNYLLLPLLPTFHFTLFLKVLLGMFAIFALAVTFITKWYTMQRLSFDVSPFLLCLLIAVVVRVLWQINSPYPLNWDMYEHQSLVNAILQNKFSFSTSQVSDTFVFDGYSTFFHFLIAASQIFFPISVFSYWQIIGYVHTFLVILASYYLAKEATENKTIAIFSALLSGFLFESTMVFTSLFFLPQTFTAVMFLFLFIQLMKQAKDKTLPSLFPVLSICLFLLLSHYVIGGLAVGVYLSYFFYQKFGRSLLTRLNTVIIVLVTILFALGMIIFSSSLSLGFLNRGEAVYYTFSLPQLYIFMQQAYGFLLLFFLPIGFFVALISKKQQDLFLFVVTIGLVTIALVHVPYVLKFFVIGRFFVYLFMAIGLYQLFHLIDNKLLRIIASCVLLLTLFVIFITNAISWKSYLIYHETFSQVSPNEEQAGLFLQHHVNNPNNTLLVSDPATQNILQAISGIKTQGGAYASQPTRTKLARFATASPAHVAKLIYAINNTVTPVRGTRILAINGRYFAWQATNTANQQALYFNIWYPLDLTFMDRLKMEAYVQDTKDFTLLYQNPTIALFAVNDPSKKR